MIKNKTYKTYSIQVGDNQSGLIEIETIILRGLYRFSILGINQRYSSDIKDRVYSALRSQNLINLKSDNKKITVNLLPTNIDKKSSIYDLGIALSCLYTMNKLDLDIDILAIGELSVTGNIIQTNRIFAAIYQAIKNDLYLIVCNEFDIKTIDENINYFNQIIIDNNLKFIVANNLEDLFTNIKNKQYHIFKNGFKKGREEMFTINKYPKIYDDNILKIIIGISTNRNIFIENTSNSYIHKFIKNLNYYNQKIKPLELLTLSDVLKINDLLVLKKYQNTNISVLDNHLDKEDIIFSLKESLFSFNIIDNFENISDDLFALIKKSYKSSMLCFYNSCPCGNNNIFFNNYENDKCFCLQRNIIRYRQRIKKREGGFFDLYIDNINQENLDYNIDDYININKLISDYKNSTIKIDFNVDKINTSVLDNKNYEAINIDKIINLAKDIRKLDNILNSTKINHVTEDDIKTSIKLLKMDF